jgi:hypothetical protein
MSYNESIVKYGDKDSLKAGNPEKRIMGYELQVEFDAIGATFEEMRDENGHLPGTTPGDGLPVGESEGQLTYWDGADWATTSLIKVVPNTAQGVVMRTSTLIGDSNDDQHFIVGDTYIGYTENGDKPDNSDTVGGTLFLNRGVIVGRGNQGNASIGMEGNIIFDLGDPTSDTCAVSKKWVEDNSLSSTGDTQLGNSNDDQHVIVGDTYIGYTVDDGKPDNNDAVGGTLFLHRGMIVGRGNVGSASIVMEGNIIAGLGNGQYNDHAVNLAQLNSSRAAMASAITDAVSKATDLDELKQGITASLKQFLES